MKESCGASKKGTGRKMARSKWWYGPEKRDYVNPPKQEEKRICRRSELCNGCPFPASGFICWSDNGDCMRTRFDKLKGTENHDEKMGGINDEESGTKP